MRIADNMLFDQVRDNVGKNRKDMSDLQNQAATQKRVTKPSDDPIAASRVLGSRVELTGQQQYLKNLNYARSFLEFTDQTLGDVTEVLVRAKELAVSQAGDAGANEESRRVTASEVEQLFQQIVSMGNRKLGDRFIFSGYKTQTSPFDRGGEYAGDSGEMLIHTDKASFLAMNIPGDQVFLGRGLSADGLVRARAQQAKDVDEFLDQQAIEYQKQMNSDDPNSKVEMRGPATVADQQIANSQPNELMSGGINIFRVLSDLEIGMRTNDKTTIQDSLDTLDQAISQVVLARSQVGSRVTAMNNLVDSLQKGKIESQQAISNHEDADVFQVVSDINKTEGTLQATLQTSGKLVQQSLLDFLR